MSCSITSGTWKIELNFNEVELRINCDSIYEHYRLHLSLSKVPENFVNLCGDLKEMYEMLSNHGSISIKDHFLIVPLFLGNVKKEAKLELTKEFLSDKAIIQNQI